ncbi:hypothetical protein GRAN_4475 [Granulicella sibirica]|uniref:Uncharacterized protein n=1 Tax=Granulicella sibirica TaxID=2479048 RepID=A0A4Q0T1F8_9BACT|nr:hypothetical protein GRAN_4475 [Granulicella sibirica]
MPSRTRLWSSAISMVISFPELDWQSVIVKSPLSAFVIWPCNVFSL